MERDKKRRVKEGRKPLLRKNLPLPLVKGKGIKGMGLIKVKRKATGILGEKLARDFLRKQGYRILEANYRCPRGEVDLVARHKDYLVFVEVRTKTSRVFGTPEESITLTKKERLIAVAAHYQQTHDNLPQLWRIDVVAVEMSPKGRPSRIELIENAVGEA